MICRKQQEQETDNFDAFEKITYKDQDIVNLCRLIENTEFKDLRENPTDFDSIKSVESCPYIAIRNSRYDKSYLHVLIDNVQVKGEFLTPSQYQTLMVAITKIHEDLENKRLSLLGQVLSRYEYKIPQESRT